MHEIITLQFGQKSNYLATHFWNTQVVHKSYLIPAPSLTNIRNHILHTQAKKNQS
jgi:hypothetical protein